LKILYITSGGKLNDEAQQKLSNEFCRRIAEEHTVFILHSDRKFSPRDLINTSIRTRPNIIHVFLRIKSTVLLYIFIFKWLCPGSRLLISALQPPESSTINHILISLLRPDLTLTLTTKTSAIFQQAGCQTEMSYCGIDTKIFVPIDSERKSVLKKKHCIDIVSPMLLHVGHLTLGRNLSLLNDLAKNNNVTVVLVVSPTQPNQVLLRELMDAGIKVFNEFFPNVEEFYQMADCYVFPTQSTSHAIELPLSVLEAMSCNLPVVTTRFGALPELFKEDASFRYANDNGGDFCAKIQEILEIPDRPSNRDKVLRFDWTNIIEEVESIYYRVLEKNI